MFALDDDDDDDGGRPDEHAMIPLALKVPLALNGAIVLPGRRVQLDADPGPGGKLGVADESNDAVSSIV